MKRTALSFLSNIYDPSESGIQKYSQKNQTGSLSANTPGAQSLESGIEEIREAVDKMKLQTQETKQQKEQVIISQKEQLDQVLNLRHQFNISNGLKLQMSNQISEIKATYQNNKIKIQQFTMDFESKQQKMLDDIKKLKDLTSRQEQLEKHQEKLKTDLADLETQKLQLTAELNDCKSNNQKLKEENTELEKSCIILQNETKSKKDQISDIEKQINDFEQQAKQISISNKKLEEEIKMNQSALDMKKKESETLENEKEKLQKQLHDVEEEINTTIKNQAQARQNQENDNQKLIELEEEIKKLQNLLDTETEKERKLKDELKTLQDSFDSEKLKTDQLKKQLEVFSNSNNLLANKNKETQNIINEKEKKIIDLRQELGNIKAQVNEKKISCQTIQAQIDSETMKQKNQLNAKKEQVKELRKQKEALEKQLEEETKNLKESETRINKLRKDTKTITKSTRGRPTKAKTQEVEPEENDDEEEEYNQQLSTKQAHFNKRPPTSTSARPKPRAPAKMVAAPKKPDNVAKPKPANRSRAEIAEALFNMTSAKPAAGNQTAIADALFDENAFKF